jgi:hypothetical protein
MRAPIVSGDARFDDCCLGSVPAFMQAPVVSGDGRLDDCCLLESGQL